MVWAAIPVEAMLPTVTTRYALIAGLLAVLLAQPGHGADLAVGRMAFWVPVAEQANFASLHERVAAPLLVQHGFISADQPPRPTPDTIVSYLYTFATPAALAAARDSLWRDARWTVALTDLSRQIGTPGDSVRCELAPYIFPAGPGLVHAAGSGRRDGLWVHYDVSDNLPATGAAALQSEEGEGLWFAALFGRGLVHYDGETYTQYTTADGLLDDILRAVFRDREDRLWLGTETGLCLLADGAFTSFTAADGLPDGRIVAIQQPPDGTLWIGGPGGLSLYDGQQFRRSEGELRGLGVSDLLADRAGGVWVATVDTSSPWGEAPVYRFRSGEATLFGESTGLGPARVNTFFEDSAGRVWLGQTGSATRLDGHRAVTLTRSDGLAPGAVSAIAEDDDGNVWFGSHHSGLSRWDGDRVINLGVAEGLPNNQVLDIAAGENGALWIGTMAGGLSRHDGVRICHLSVADGLPAQYVFASLEDRDGTLWFGTAWGLARYDSAGFVTYQTQDGLAHNRVWDLGQDDAGTIWVLHDGQAEMTRISGRTFETVPVDGGGKRSGIYGQDAMAAGADNDVWKAAGSVLTRRQGERLRPWSLDGLPVGAHVTSLATDRSGQLWLGAGSDGVWRSHGSSAVRVDTVRALRSASVSYVGEDRRGRLWAGYASGQVAVVSGGEPAVYTPDSGTRIGMVRTLIEDRRGHLWIGTWGTGVVRFDGLVFQYLSLRNGLINNGVQDIVEDRHGDLWICTDGGITRYRPSTIAPSIRLDGVVADRRYEPGEEVSISSSQDLLTIEYRGLSALTPRSELAYVYRLVGRDEAWQVTRQTSVSYGDLPIGEYAFEVKAVDSDLNYSQPAAVRLVVTPAYGQLALVLGLALSFVGLAVAASYGVRRRRERDEARVELVKERRQRIEVQPHHIDAWTVDDFAGSSPALHRVLAQIRDLQRSDDRILITGETGTGKELAARAVHAGSGRGAGPFVPVRCAGLPADVTSLDQRTVALSELFGHRRGAFPGADADRDGLVQQATGGTLFLDEVGVLPLPLQAHLLRVLSQGQVQRTGSTDVEPLDLRVVAATSEDLEMQTEIGAFSRELYVYLTDHTLAIPPLRERLEDLGPLARQLIDGIAGELQVDGVDLSDEAIQSLRRARLPGNARELRALLERAMRRRGGGTLRPEDLES